MNIVQNREHFGFRVLGLDLEVFKLFLGRVQDRVAGEHEYSTLRALGSEVAACCSMLFWPKERRSHNEFGRTGILHVKCAVADGRWLFLSSANLTEYAFTINMELGVLINGGNLPLRIQQHFDRLESTHVLERL
jgi:phosphatidylserine/phosphatidylglycerophosphate/cardiolipin synthase-like enzyme